MSGQGTQGSECGGHSTVPPGPGQKPPRECSTVERGPKAPGKGGTDLLGEQSSMLILHRPVLSKHIIKLLNDFRAM